MSSYAIALIVDKEGRILVIKESGKDYWQFPTWESRTIGRWFNFQKFKAFIYDLLKLPINADLQFDCLDPSIYQPFLGTSCLIYYINIDPKRKLENLASETISSHSWEKISDLTQKLQDEVHLAICELEFQEKKEQSTKTDPITNSYNPNQAIHPDDIRLLILNGNLEKSLTYLWSYSITLTQTDLEIDTIISSFRYARLVSANNRGIVDLELYGIEKSQITNVVVETLAKIENLANGIEVLIDPDGINSAIFGKNEGLTHIFKYELELAINKLENAKDLLIFKREYNDLQRDRKNGVIELQALWRLENNLADRLAKALIHGL